MEKAGVEQATSNFAELFKSFEMLIEYRRKLCIADDHMSKALCGLYAAAGAYQILEGISSRVSIESDLSCNVNDDTQQASPVLPTYETVRRTTRELLSAVSSKNHLGVIDALKEMGILSLCRQPDAPFSQMEQFASGISGQAEAVFLVELSLFAAKSGRFEQASRYVQRAHTCNPRSIDLYNLRMVEGLIALNAGRVHDAIRCLADSLDPCLEDVQAASECGVLAPNLELVEKLVEHGERIEVLRHLSDCLDLWVRFRSEITEWMGIIERGDIPDFHSAESINEASRPSWKLRIQWLRACSLESEPYSTSLKARMSRTQVLAARAESAARHKAGFDAWVKKGIEYLENGPAAEGDGLDSPR